MADKTLTVTGFPKLEAALRRLGDRGPRAGLGALYREGERIMTEAKRRTPVATGALRASGQVVTDGPTRVVLAFGNAAATYAVFVHEDLQARHMNGEAKFLERPLLEAARDMDKRLAAEVRREVERLGQ
jgi:hypothetical protein